MPQNTRQPKILYTHPSHLNWWILPNLEKADKVPDITHFACVFVEKPDNPQDSVVHLEKIAARCEALGIELIYGLRFSNPTKETVKDWMQPEWHEAMTRKLAWIRSPAGIFLDCEPYYNEGQRYIGWHKDVTLRLYEAALPWWTWAEGNLSVPLFVYPANEGFPQMLSVMTQAAASRNHWERRAWGGNPRIAPVYACDAQTYPGSTLIGYRPLLDQKRSFYSALGLTYCPGFYLWGLQDVDTMERVKDQPCWFYARTAGHKDDLPHFGLPEWAPKRPE